MNKTLNINLAGIIFHMDEDTFQHFNAYLSRVKEQFKNADERAEIIADIEARIAELFQAKLNSSKQVISKADVDEVIAIMGSPEDYADEAETSGDSNEATTGFGVNSGPKRLFRNPDDKILGGVSGGIAAYFDVDPLWIRLIWVALFFGFGTGFLLYIILWIVMPEAKTTAQKLQMRGAPINISNIEKTVKEEMKEVQDRFKNFNDSGKLRQTGSKARNFVEDAVAAILNVLRYIIGFILKFIGVVLMFAGVIVLIVLFGLMMGSDLNINGVNIEWHNISAYLDALMPGEAAQTFLTVGVIMLALAPIIALILLGMRILFNQRVKNKFTQFGLGLMSLIGFIFVLFSIVSLVKNFAQEAIYSETIDLDSNYTAYTIRVTEMVDDLRKYEVDWNITEESQLISMVDLDVLKTESKSPYIEIETESRGKDRLEARKRARNYRYFLEQKDSIINLADYFSIPKDEKFRLQRMKIHVYLPEGKQIYLDESTLNILHDIKNTSNTWDAEMVDHIWMMTENGLVCTDCKEDNQTWRSSEEWSDFDQQFEQEAKDFEKSTSQRLDEAEKKLKEAQAELEQLKKKQQSK